MTIFYTSATTVWRSAVSLPVLHWLCAKLRAVVIARYTHRLKIQAGALVPALTGMTGQYANRSLQRNLSAKKLLSTTLTSTILNPSKVMLSGDGISEIRTPLLCRKIWEKWHESDCNKKQSVSSDQSVQPTEESMA